MSSISGSLVGLALSQSLILTGMVQHGVRQFSEVVSQITSVERIMEYTKIKKEGNFITEEGWELFQITFCSSFVAVISR